MKKLVDYGVNMVNKRSIGSIYEAAAARYLDEQGFMLIGKNHYTPFGEIDLIYEKNSILYFVEVKYRASDAFGTPKEALDSRKLKRMKQSAMHYLKGQTDGYQRYKISFMGIKGTHDHLEFDFIENIFS